jgi:hypothetical protein
LHGGNLITKALKINGGKFSFDGKSTLRGVGSNSVMAPVACATRSYSAKYYGVNPQG